MSCGSQGERMVEGDKRYRILFLLQTLGTGGSERLVLDIARSLDRDRFLPFVGSLMGGTLQKAFQDKGIETVVFNKKSGVDFSLFGKIGRLLRREKIDLVNVHHYSPLFYIFPSSFLSPGVKTIHTEHATIDFQPAVTQWGGLFAWMTRNVDMNVAISKGVAERFREIKGLDEKKIVTILNGIDFPRFDLCRDPASREEFGLPGTAKVIGMFGNFRPQKNHRNLLMAFQSVLREVPKAYLLLAGEGELLESMKTLSRDLEISDHILFLGPRLDIPRLMGLLDVYCLPSLLEGLPLSLLEAMGCGVCVVGTNVSGNNELILDGRNGILVPSDDPGAMADALVRTLKDAELRKRLSVEGRMMAREQYSLDGMMRKYEALFRSHLADRHRA